MNHVRREPQWWILYTSVGLIMTLALLAHFAHISGGDLKLVCMVIAALTCGLGGLWIWRNRGKLP